MPGWAYDRWPALAPFGKGFRLLYREEPIIVNGQPSGAITSGMYGHRVEASLGMGYVRAEEPVTADWLAAQKFEIEIG